MLPVAIVGEGLLKVLWKSCAELSLKRRVCGQGEQRRSPIPGLIHNLSPFSVSSYVTSEALSRGKIIRVRDIV
jgi:hypothetical protein